MTNHLSRSLPPPMTGEPLGGPGRVPEEWNRTATDYPRDRCIHDLFEEQVARASNAVAVIWQGRPVTYGELNTRANQLAHHLRDLGVPEAAAVGVHVGRSLEYVVSVLGILKAGGAYVPLALDYPGDRLRFMVRDSGAAAVVSDATPPAPARRLELPADLSVVDLQRDAPRIRRCSAGNPEPHRTSEDIAYIMYTSGSTGRPKGVMIPHRGVVRLVRGQQYAEFGPGEQLPAAVIHGVRRFDV